MVNNSDETSQSVFKLNGLTGVPYPSYSTNHLIRDVVPHTGSTVFATTFYDTHGQSNDGASVVGIDPLTGGQKFRSIIPIGTPHDLQGPLIIAGDGYAYQGYSTRDACGDNCQMNHLNLKRVSSSGASTEINLLNWQSEVADLVPVSMSLITKADAGVFVSIGTNEGIYLARTDGASVTLTVPETVPGQDGACDLSLQQEDRSLVASCGTYTVALSENNSAVRWAVANESPRMALEDAGVLGQSGTRYDQGGSAVGRSPLFTQAWRGRFYAPQLGMLAQVLTSPVYPPLSFWAFQGANPSANRDAVVQRDWRTNDLVDQKYLTAAFWSRFRQSHCGEVLASMQYPYYSLDMAKRKQNATNYYDVCESGSTLGFQCNPGVGALTMRQVTNGEFNTSQTIAARLGGKHEFVEKLGFDHQSAVVVKHFVITGDGDAGPSRLTLAHATIFHAYLGWSDDNVFGQAALVQNGLWRPVNDTRTTFISTWMGTDCRCQPENQAPPAGQITHNDCQKKINKAPWLPLP